MPPKQVVDLDLDAIAPPRRTVRLNGRVYELPGDMPIDTIVRAMQLQGQMESEDEDKSLAAINELLEIIYDLFRQCDPEFVPMPLGLNAVMQILGLVLSGMEIDFEQAVKEALVGLETDEDAQPEDGADHPPTSPPPAAEKAQARPSRSRKRSPVRS